MIAARSATILSRSRGVVDYAGLKKQNDMLDAYPERRASIDPDALGRHAQFAFYVNAYNRSLNGK